MKIKNSRYYVEYYVLGDRREFWFENPVPLKTCQIVAAIINFLIMRDDLDGITDLAVYDAEWYPLFGTCDADFLPQLLPCLPPEGGEKND
jgi:hypothetical protein